MARQLSTAEQEQRRRARIARGARREAREKEEARWVFPGWLNALILGGGGVLGAGIAMLVGPGSWSDADPVQRAVPAIVLGAVSGLLISAGVLGGLRLRPRWWYAGAALPIGVALFFVGLDALGAGISARVIWMVRTVLFTIGYFGPMIISLTSPRSISRLLPTAGGGVAAVIGGAILLYVGLTSDEPIFVGFWMISGRALDYSLWDGVEPIAFAVAGLMLMTLGGLAVLATLAALLRKALPPNLNW